VKRTYTSGEAARICDLSLSTIKRWIKRGALRIYRTPGGDIRIPHEHLRDFMREYDIPTHRLEPEEPRILVALAAGARRRTLLRELYAVAPQARVEFAENELDLGFALGRFRPWVLLLPGARASAAACTAIRDRLAPEPVRIGAVGPPAESETGPGGADLALEETDPGAAALFFENLVGATLERRSA
jgi:excisionase family DNA binding protein